MRWRLFSNSTQLQNPVQTSRLTHDVRRHLYLEVFFDGVSGFGESSPQPVPLNGDPGFGEVVEELLKYVMPAFEDICRREGQPPKWFRAGRLAASRPSSNFAVALLEMALLDLELKTGSIDLPTLWEPRYEVKEQVTISNVLTGALENLSAASRVRLKVGALPIAPEVVSAIERLSAPVILDFNCEAGTVENVLAKVAQLDGLIIAAVEQPFAVGNLADQVLLKDHLTCELSLDEGVRNYSDVQLIARHNAASLLCVKPARVGGFANAKVLMQRANQLGIRTYVGGFFESPLGRTANRVFASHVSPEPSDVMQVSFTEKALDGWEQSPFGIGIAPTEALKDTATQLGTSTIHV